jgi:DNA-binding transcriptional ArsR family regulator
LQDRTAALAAAFVIAHRHPEILQWVAETIAPPPAEPVHYGKTNGSASAAKAKVKVKPKSKGSTTYDHLERLRAKRDSDDLALLEAMRTSPRAAVPDLARAIQKSKSSVMTALHRLEEAGMVAHEDHAWMLIGDEPKPPPEKWVSSLSAATARAHAHA